MAGWALGSEAACWGAKGGQSDAGEGGAGVHRGGCCGWWCCGPPGGEATIGQLGAAKLPVAPWGKCGGGDVAVAAIGLPLPPPWKLSEALRRENMVRASGKLGGVAGVLAGVHICGEESREGGVSTLSPDLPMAPSWTHMPRAPQSTSQGLTKERCGAGMGWPATPAGGSEKVLSQWPLHGQEPLQRKLETPEAIGDTYHLVVVVIVGNVGLLEKGAEGCLWEEKPKLNSQTPARPCCYPPSFPGSLRLDATLGLSPLQPYHLLKRHLGPLGRYGGW